jgi:hypothetical protein
MDGTATVGRTGYNVREGSAILADRFRELSVCSCGETEYRGKCLNVGGCPRADRAASRQSLRRGAASSVAAWTLGGRVD